jgi:hypothetical protein
LALLAVLGGCSGARKTRGQGPGGLQEDGGPDGSYGKCAYANGGCGDPAFFSCTENAGAPPTCDDIDECAHANGGCGDPAFSTCTDHLGAGPSCDDVDE